MVFPAGVRPSGKIDSGSLKEMLYIVMQQWQWRQQRKTGTARLRE
jgi:hypothetical protein